MSTVFIICPLFDNSKEDVVHNVRQLDVLKCCDRLIINLIQNVKKYSFVFKMTSVQFEARFRISILTFSFFAG